MRTIPCLLMAWLWAAAVSADPINWLTDSRSVSVSLSAPSPPALIAQQSMTNLPGGAFADLHLSASGNIGWQQVDGWTAAPATASANQDVTFSPSQFTLQNILSVGVGGDPFGVHFASPSSGTVHAVAWCQVSFFVATVTDYDYQFDFSPSSTLEQASLTLSSLGHGTQTLFTTGGNPGVGMLEPDTYTVTCFFSSFANGDKAGINSSSLVMNFVPAPEPAIGAVFLLGIATIWLGRRHRR